MKFEFKINEAGSSIETACTMPDMFSAVCTLVHCLYESFESQPKLQGMFKSLLTTAFESGLPFKTFEKQEPKTELDPRIEEFLEKLNRREEE